MLTTKRTIIIFIAALILTLLVMRTTLFLFPLKVSVGAYKIRHLFTGSLLLIFSAIFLIMNIKNKLVIILTGILSGLILDEIIFLIFTDASYESYKSSVSLIGAIVLTLLVLIFVSILYKIKASKL